MKVNSVGHVRVNVHIRASYKSQLSLSTVGGTYIYSIYYLMHNYDSQPLHAMY